MEVAGQVRSIQLDTSVSHKRRKVDSSDPILLPTSSLSDNPLPNHCCLSGSDSPKNSVSPSTTTFEFPDQTSLCWKNQSLINSSSTSSDLKGDETCGTREILVSPSQGFSSHKNNEEIMHYGSKKKRKISQASSIDAAKMPSTEEIEEFFSVAEKVETKRFMEKYNYDIVKDVALEGRYQWVCLKP